MSDPSGFDAFKPHGLRFETADDAHRYQQQLLERSKSWFANGQPATRRVYIKDISLSDFDGCKSLADWRSVINQWEAMVPVEFRDATVIACVDDYETGLQLMSPYYDRPETEQDMIDDTRADQARKDAEEAGARAKYEELKKRFG